MKKLFTLCSIMLLGAVNVFAQEEEVDMTHYIVNAGFDEDLTFNADGSYKEGTVANTDPVTLSNRSWSYIHPDGSCYAHTDSRSNSWKGSDGRTWATNGYVAAIKGWECTRTDYPKCEWVYFGVLPYDLEEKAIPVADDGTTYQIVPAKPDFANGDDNKGALFLRAGWSGQCSYKQVVKLPCAVYRLEYWSINVNTSSSRTPTDLTNITCRKDVFKDESGSNLTATEWTKHEFEFTPTSEFTVEFGYKATNNGSGQQAYVFIDGIKLYKIGEADKAELLEADWADICDSLYSRLDNENITGGLADEIYEVTDNTPCETEEELEAAIKYGKEFLVKVDAALVEIAKFNVLTAKADVLLNSEVQYPGANALNDAYTTIMKDFEAATINDYAGLVVRMEQAISDYYFSQEASDENPADYTFLVKHPNFVKEGYDPTYAEDGTATYPGELEDIMTVATSEGWYKGTVQSGDQRLGNNQGRVCWNLWDNQAGLHAISQDLTDLPSGYYTVTADMITQPDWPHEAHVYAKTSASDVSSPFLTVGNWAGAEPWGAWTTLTTEKIIVAEGKLTIGGRSDFPEGSQKGWFNITNVKLHYYGPIKFEDYQALYNAKIAAAEAMCDTMVFAADKAAFADSIAASKGATTMDEITEKLNLLNRSQATAQASIDKWQGVKTGSWANLKDSIANSVYTGDVAKIAQKAVDLMTSNIYAAEATYTKMDSLTTILRKYRDNYLPAFIDAQTLKFKTTVAQEVFNATITLQVSELTDIESLPSAKDMDSHLANLNAAIAEAERLDVIASVTVEDGADMTGLIANPEIKDDAINWTVNHNGNTNTATGQSYDFGNINENSSDTGRYLDSWRGSGLLYTASQELANVPNGTYELKAMTRTSGEGFYLFAIADKDSVNAKFAHTSMNEINYTKMVNNATVKEDGSDSIAVVADLYGPIWEEAVMNINANLGINYLYDATTESGLYSNIQEYQANNDGKISDENMLLLNIAAANKGAGRGWAWTTISNIEVTDHVLSIGVTTDTLLTKGHNDLDGNACIPFTGTWVSADNFKLTLVKVGDNTGWDQMATGIESVETPENIAVRVENGAIIANGEIYNISGTRVANGTKVPAGVYIVRQGKVAQKVLVK